MLSYELQLGGVYIYTVLTAASEVRRPGTNSVAPRLGPARLPVHAAGD